MLRRLAILIVACTCVRTAAADSQWHAGLDLRVDNGAHPIRTGAGLQLGALDTELVVDPMVVFDGQHDLDLLAIFGKTYSALAGWRTTSIGIAGGMQFQQKLVLGVSAPLPVFGSAPLRARFAFELATVIVKHGGDLPSETISFASGRDFVDLVNFGMWVTFEYARHM